MIFKFLLYDYEFAAYTSVLILLDYKAGILGWVNVAYLSYLSYLFYLFDFLDPWLATA